MKKSHNNKFALIPKQKMSSHYFCENISKISGFFFLKGFINKCIKNIVLTNSAYDRVIYRNFAQIGHIINLVSISLVDFFLINSKS